MSPTGRERRSAGSGSAAFPSIPSVLIDAVLELGAPPGAAQIGVAVVEVIGQADVGHRALAFRVAAAGVPRAMYLVDDNRSHVVLTPERNSVGFR